MSQPTSEPVKHCEPGSFCVPLGYNRYDLFNITDDYEPLMFGVEVNDVREEEDQPAE